MIVTKTPFRLSFFGGGTDFPDFYREHGATVLSTTFDKYCYVSLRRLPLLFPYKSEFVYSKTERVTENGEIEHPAIREAMRWQGLSQVRLTYDADLPARSGLGTSSAFAVGMLHAMHIAKGEDVTPLMLAREAIELERVRCKESGGVQDQIAAAFGGFNRIDFAGDTFTVTPLAIDTARKKMLEENLMLFFTGVSRYSMALQEAHQKAIPQKTAELCLMRDMARASVDLLLRDAPLAEFGELLHEAWCLKRGISASVTTDMIDAFYEKARRAGALGGKLLGAGGGGFLLFYVEPDKREAVRKALSPLVEVSFSFTDVGTRIVTNTGF
ncbi:MAG: kinase [Clostridia bacterium]|nr:kinase [Clostridia bacterium]